MTTIPDVAIQAAAEALYEVSKTSDMRHQPDFTPATFETDARAALTAALPLLGDTTTEYSVRVARRGETPHVLGDTERLSCHSNRGEAERGAWRLRGFQTTTTVVQRTVITGEWTEAPSE